MKKLLLVAVAVSAFTACKKGGEAAPTYDQLNLAFNTKMGTAYDTTYINLKSRFSINAKNFESSIIYNQVSDKEANVAILTAHSVQRFNFQWYLTGDAIAYFDIYKKEAKSTAKYGF